MNKKRVVVGMSGGVDSSVAIQILKDMGFTVFGVTFKLFDWQDYKDAQTVAQKLSIPYEVVDISKEFQTEVMDYFVDEYTHGKTPNPCVLCNREVKFSHLIKYADYNSIDFVATGHYARVEKDRDRYLLKKSSDLRKDQSYFLHRLTQEQLGRVIFPLEGRSKEEVRKIAREIGLDVAKKKDSQEVCFVSNDDYVSFIEKNSKKVFSSGDIVDTEGNVLGQHNGIHKYTIGQRRRIGISSKKPLFVVDIDSERNIVVVGDNKDILRNEFKVKNLNWISIDELLEPMNVSVKIRSTASEVPARIERGEEGDVIVKVQQAVRAVTAGQSAVFYDEDTVVGGGVIMRS